MISDLQLIDENLLIFIQSIFVNSVWTPIWTAVTTLGNAGAIWIILTIILILNKPTRKVGLMSAAALLGALLIDNVILKNLAARARPYDTVDMVQLLTEPQKDYSFPSGHTGSSFASAVVLYRGLPKKYGIPALVLASLIGFSRLYLGVHYPSDVIFGALIGSVIGWSVYCAAQKKFEHL